MSMLCDNQRHLSGNDGNYVHKVRIVNPKPPIIITAKTGEFIRGRPVNARTVTFHTPNTANKGRLLDFTHAQGKETATYETIV